MSERHLAAAQKMDVLHARHHSNTKSILLQKNKKKEKERNFISSKIESFFKLLWIPGLRR